MNTSWTEERTKQINGVIITGAQTLTAQNRVQTVCCHHMQFNFDNTDKHGCVVAYSLQVQGFGPHAHLV